ncbi:MAG: PEP-CTERM sorting domain-containing protein [Pirellulaceae bacterium]
MFSRLFVCAPALLLFLVCLCISSASHANVIQPGDVVAIPQNVVGSGNGTLDLRMFTFSGSEIDNSSGSFNADNANNTLPNSGGSDTGSFVESYVTTAGELQDYYILNFPNGGGGSTVNEMALILDLNETGGGQPLNSLDRLDIVINPATIQGNPDASLDVNGAGQAGIDQVYTSGSLAANLASALNVPTVQQGAGFADYAIYTGIAIFALDPNDVVLFNISMSTLNNGSEEIFLSGEFAPQDIAAVPEPTSGLLTLLLLAGIIAQRRSRA